MHRLTDGHANAVSDASESMGAGVGVPGAVGLNVTSSTPASMAVHWLTDGQAKSVRPVLSIVTAAGAAGEIGLKVASCPLVSTTVHWLVEGQAIATAAFPGNGSTLTGVGLPGAAGLNVTSSPN
jgi:hypothetical protein